MKTTILTLLSLILLALPDVHAQKAKADGFEFTFGAYRDTTFKYKCNYPYLVRKRYQYRGLTQGRLELNDSILLTSRTTKLLEQYLNSNRKEFANEYIRCRAMSLVSASIRWKDGDQFFEEEYYPCRVDTLPQRFINMKTFLEQELFKPDR